MEFGKVDILLWLVLFGGCLVYDYVNARYIRAVAEYNRTKASLTSMFLVAVGGLFTVEYIKNIWNLVPIVLGCGLGTFLSFGFKKL